MTTTEETLAPLPRGDGDVVVAPPGEGPGYWAGAPSAVAADGAIYLAHRLRRPVDDGRGFGVVIGRSTDGVDFETVSHLEKEPFGAASLERPALVQRPDGGWRVYVSCSTPGSYHWWIDAIDADDPTGFVAERRTTVMPGDAAHRGERSGDRASRRGVACVGVLPPAGRSGRDRPHVHALCVEP